MRIWEEFKHERPKQGSKQRDRAPAGDRRADIRRVFANYRAGHGDVVSRQRGSTLLIYLGVGILIAAMGTAALLTYNSAIARAERAEADAATLRTINQEQLAENANLKAAKDRADKLLAQRQTARNTADNIERAINAKLAEIYRSSEPARAWRDAAVPADVLRSLRAESTGAPSKDGKGIPTGKPAGNVNAR